MKLLVTGAGGSIGRVLGERLPSLGHELRGLDLVPPAGEEPALGWVVGDCLDPHVVDRAVAGVDAVVHLAGDPDEASLPDSLSSHVHTTARLLEAMVRHGVARMVYASSNHAVGRTPRADGKLTVTVRPRPDTFYGVAKVAAESLLSLYADRHDITAVAVRIGSFEPQPVTTRHLSTWLSPGDVVRLVDAAVRLDEPGLHVVHGISSNTRGWWDLEPGRAIGYEPTNDAETFAGTITPRASDEIENAFVGGPHVTSAFVREAF